MEFSFKPLPIFGIGPTTQRALSEGISRPWRRTISYIRFPLEWNLNPKILEGIYTKIKYLINDIV